MFDYKSELRIQAQICFIHHYRHTSRYPDNHCIKEVLGRKNKPFLKTLADLIFYIEKSWCFGNFSYQPKMKEKSSPKNQSWHIHQRKDIKNVDCFISRGLMGVHHFKSALQTGGKVLLATAAAEVEWPGCLSPGGWELWAWAAQHHQCTSPECQSQPRWAI